MNNRYLKQPFMELKLLGVFVSVFFMFTSLVFGCQTDSVTFYTGKDATQAEAMTHSTVYIPLGNLAYFYAECTVTNPELFSIQWLMDRDADGQCEYSTTTSYYTSANYLTAPDSGATWRTFSSGCGHWEPRVVCYLIDGSDSPPYVDDTCDVYVVGVASVSAGGKTSTPGDIKTVYVAKGSPGATIPVTAESTYSYTWPDDNPTWTNATATSTAGQATFPIDTVTSSSGVTVTATCGTSSLSINIVVVEVASVSAGSITSTTNSPGTAETLYLANDYYDEPANRTAKTQSVLAVLNPDIDPTSNFSWSPDGETPLPTISPDTSKSATFTAKDHSLYTIAAYYGSTYKAMKIALEGVDISTSGITAADEMTKTYNIFLNENFDQNLNPVTTTPGHTTCYDVDCSNNSIAGDSSDEIGTISFNKEIHGDTGAQVKFEASGIKLYKSETEMLTLGTYYNVSDIPATLRVEGTSSGVTTLKATIKTQHNATAIDQLKIKVIPLNLKAVSPAPSADQHEICHKDKLIIIVNHNDSDQDGLSDNDTNDTVIAGGDPDIAKITLEKPTEVDSDISGSITVTYPANINAWKHQDKSGGAAATTFALSDLPTDIYLEGKTASSAFLDSKIKVEMTLDSGVKCRDEIWYTVINVDLDAMKMNHNAPNGELEEDEETKANSGAFVPLNNDDDDYTATPGGATGSDKAQTGAITGESDLMHIKMHKVVPTWTGSKYTLTIPANVKVWTNSNRSGAVSSGTTEFDATVDKTLYVEGYTAGTNKIKINWKIGTNTLNECDVFKESVFEWLGPLNVPGYAIYQYKVNSPPTGGQWITPTSGTIHSGSGTSDVTILWGSGPAVGKAVYQANASYIWDLEVNVVRVKFKSTGNTAWYANPATDGPVQVGGANSALIKSSSSANCMTAEIIVESVDGPTVGGSQRGRKFITIGHVHQARFDSKHGEYTTISKLRKSSLEDGMIHWDAFIAGTIPWTFMTANHYLDITTDTQVVSDHKFETHDNPTLLGVDSANFSISGDQVDILKLDYSHWLYIAVKAKGPNINGSAGVLTQRAKLEWSTDITGTINAAGVYSLTGPGVSGDASYNEITNGNEVPNAQANINESFSSEAWATL